MNGAATGLGRPPIGVRWSAGWSAAALAFALLTPNCTYETVPGHPDCESDSDCSDRVACNGEERCISGQCQAGAPVTCQAGLECIDTSAGTTCASAAESTWLVYGTVSSDGRALYARNIKAGIGAVSVRIDTGLRASEVFAPGSAAWSPDGKSLAFRTQAKTPGTTATPTALYWIDMSGPLPRPPQPVLDLGAPFSWAPDSSGLVVSDSVGALYWVRIRNGSPDPALELTEALPDTLPLGGASYDEGMSLVDTRFRWSPAARSIAYKLDGKLFWKSLTSSAPVQLSGVEQVKGYSWSPDGTRVVFASGASDALSVAIVPPASPQVISSSSSGFARWSPDSRYISFVNGSATSVRDVRAGGSPVPLVSVAASTCWSPGSSEVAATPLSGAGPLTILGVLSQKTRALPYAVKPQDAACWSPKGNFFSFVASDGASRALWVYRAAALHPETGTSGMDDSKLIDSSSESASIVHQIAPDDSGLIYVRGSELARSAFYIELTSSLSSSSAQPPLVANKASLAPKFSAAGSYVAFTWTVSGADELSLVYVRGTRPFAITPLVVAADHARVTDWLFQPR